MTGPRVTGLDVDEAQAIVKALAVHIVKLTGQIRRARRAADRGQGKPGRLAALAMEAADVDALFNRMRAERDRLQAEWNARRGADR